MFRQLPSQHSHDDGTEKLESKRTDLGGVHVLIADDYAYFGHEGPPLSAELAFLKAGRGHRCRFTAAEVAQVAGWFQTLPKGVSGRPEVWPKADLSWRQT